MRLTDDALITQIDTAQAQSMQSSSLPRWVVLAAWSIVAGLYIVYVTQFAWLGAYRLREVVCRPIMPPDLLHLIDLCVLGVFIPEGIAHITMITASMFMLMRRSNNWLTAFSALALLLVSAGFSSISFGLSGVPDLSWAGRLVLSISVWMTIVFLITFPDGRFFPRWTIALVIFYSVWIASWWFVPELDISQGLTQISFASSLIATPLLTFSMWVRFRRVLTADQRQRIRLVIAAALYTYIVYGTALIITLLVRSALSGSISGTIIFILATWGRWVAITLLPIAILISIVRFQLFDVDRIIGRGLLVTAITLLLAVVFGGLVLGVQQVALIATGNIQSNLAVVLAALAIALIFQPVRHRLQQLIDSRYFVTPPAPSAAATTAPDVLTAASTNTATNLRLRAQTQGALTHTEIGAYTVGALIGRGGMAEVYHARHRVLERDTAIKILNPHLADDPHFRSRFTREGRMLSELTHPHIVRVYDAGEYEGIYYIAMQYIEGETLAALLARKGAFSLDRALPILTPIASALDHAHARNMIHRDVKPHNILLSTTGSGETPHPYLADFGIARMIGANTIFTEDVSVMGTLDYAAPEQIDGREEIDYRADIYALGVVAYQMLTAHLPFREAHIGALIASHLRKPAPDPRTIVPDLPAHTAIAIMRALAKDPEDRFDRASAFVAALT